MPVEIRIKLHIICDLCGFKEIIETSGPLGIQRAINKARETGWLRESGQGSVKSKYICKNCLGESKTKINSILDPGEGVGVKHELSR